MYKYTIQGIKVKIKDAVPDIIIHKRKSNEFNLAIIEFKKGNPSKENRKNDEEKLQYFTNQNNEYRFRYGFWVVLKRKYAEVHVYSDGKERAHCYYKLMPKLLYIS